MVPLAVILTIILFATVDYGLRVYFERKTEQKKRKERAEALNVGLRLTFSEETKSLKRVEVENPRARILAVDDESVILDAFRKILVMEGYSIDTVESGPEALSLVKKNNYDFVFTDFKMPEMDGVEVIKGVKHLKPDIDVVLITGFATLESAVETMKMGAMDYVQKPFTDEELSKLVNQFLIRRQERLEKERKPVVHLVTPSVKAATGEKTFNVFSGIFIASGHTWVSIEPDGAARVGMDDFAQKILGDIKAVELPNNGQVVSKGGTLFTLIQGEQKVSIPSPLSGKVTYVNASLLNTPGMINVQPYNTGWVCRLEPVNLSGELGTLKIGANAMNWYQAEVDRYMQVQYGDTGNLSWEALGKNFLSA